MAGLGLGLNVSSGTISSGALAYLYLTTQDGDILQAQQDRGSPESPSLLTYEPNADITSDTLAGPKDLIKAMAKLQSQSTTNPSSISQAAAVEALNGTQDFIKSRTKSFKERRDFVLKSLNNIKGLSCLKPNGAFYVFPNCQKLLGTKLKTDKDFVEKLLEEALVAVVQGSAFGLDGYFRISYATSMDNLKKAIERIKSFCENLT